MPKSVEELEFEIEVLKELVFFMAAELPEQARQRIAARQQENIMTQNEYETLAKRPPSNFDQVSDERATRIKFTIR